MYYILLAFLIIIIYLWVTKARRTFLLVMCGPGLAQKPGFGFGRLRLLKTQARPIVKAQAWLGLGLAQAQALPVNNKY